MTIFAPSSISNWLCAIALNERFTIPPFIVSGEERRRDRGEEGERVRDREAQFRV